MDWNKYPRAKKFLDETGMTLDEAIDFLDKELEKNGT